MINTFNNIKRKYCLQLIENSLCILPCRIIRTQPYIGSFIRRETLKGLEEHANLYPHDAEKQSRFLSELRELYPEQANKRFLDERFAITYKDALEYIADVVKSGAIRNNDEYRMMIQHLTRRLQNQNRNNTSELYSSNTNTSNQYNLNPHFQKPPLIPGSEISGNSPKNPIYVSLSEQHGKSLFFGIMRFMLAGVLVASVISFLMDEKGGGGIFGPVKSRLVDPSRSDKKFSDVKGCDEAKHELEEIVQYLKNKQRFTRLGGNLPKGVLLVGPPGTGKTLLAKAIAGEAGVPFFYASGSDFEEMYVGLGAKRVRELFEQAKAKSPCIIFIDEIDAVGGKRQLREHSAMKMTLNQLLVELDGFGTNSGIIVIGATNFPDSLDNALVRPGRFDRHVVVPLPDIAGRKQILELYLSKVPTTADVDIDVLARATPGLSGADLHNIVNEAALRGAMLGLSKITMEVMEYAKDKILMGSERKSAVISPESARLTAYHEGGHALIAVKTPGADPVYKATIMPRGQALGMVTSLPEGDQTSINKEQLIASLDVCMGGRAAEELVYGPKSVTAGAISDFQKATATARKMIAQFGMNEKIGPVYHDMKSEDFSPHTKKIIDDEVRALLDESYGRAKQILIQHRDQLDRLAEALLKYETLSGKEVKDILDGKELTRKV